MPSRCPLFFFFNDTATTEIYTLSLHDALPISHRARRGRVPERPRQGSGRRGRNPLRRGGLRAGRAERRPGQDRKSTRLNSSHGYISYAVFCLKKKKKQDGTHIQVPAAESSDPS